MFKFNLTKIDKEDESIPCKKSCPSKDIIEKKLDQAYSQMEEISAEATNVFNSLPQIVEGE